jgi:hypothetical protein
LSLVPFVFQRWRYDQVRVPHSSETFNWFSGVTAWGKYALLVGVEGTGIGARQVIGRLPMKDLTDLDFARMEGTANAGSSAIRGLDRGAMVHGEWEG